MNEEKFLIDSNSLITPHLNYYPFDFAPRFWTQIGQHIKDGKIAILDIVKEEILQGNDHLTEWMNELKIGEYIDHREEIILSKYGAVLQYIQQNPCYRPSALAEWSKANIADAWLIATAASYNLTLITFETFNNGLNQHNPSKNAKIPNIAKAFNVKTENLFYLMRELQFKL